MVPSRRIRASKLLAPFLVVGMAASLLFATEAQTLERAELTGKRVRIKCRSWWLSTHDIQVRDWQLRWVVGNVTDVTEDTLRLDIQKGRDMVVPMASVVAWEYSQKESQRKAGAWRGAWLGSFVGGAIGGGIVGSQHVAQDFARTRREPHSFLDYVADIGVILIPSIVVGVHVAVPGAIIGALLSSPERWETIRIFPEAANTHRPSSTSLLYPPRRLSRSSRLWFGVKFRLG